MLEVNRGSLGGRKELPAWWATYAMNRPPREAYANTGDLMQRPKLKTASGSRASSDPERHRDRHAPAPLFDLADLGAQDFDVPMGAART